MILFEHALNGLQRGKSHAARAGSHRAGGTLRPTGLVLACALATVALSGCPGTRGRDARQGSSTEQATATDLGIMTGGWAGIISTRMTPLTEDLIPTSEGWSLLYRADYPAAYEAFEDTIESGMAGEDVLGLVELGQARAAVTLGQFYQEVHRSNIDLQGFYLLERQRRLGAGWTPTFNHRLTLATVQLWELVDHHLHGAAVSEPGGAGGDGQNSAEDIDRGAIDWSFIPGPGAGGGGEDARLTALAVSLKGLHRHLEGQQQEARALWERSQSLHPLGAVAAAYAQAKAGLQVNEVPSGDGTTLGRRLQFGALLHSGRLEEAERHLHWVIGERNADYADQAHQGVDTDDGVETGADRGDASETAPLYGVEYFFPGTSLDLATYYYRTAHKVLDSVGANGGDRGEGLQQCRKFWRGVALQGVGDRGGASPLLEGFIPEGTSKTMAPAVELACTMFSPYRNHADMVEAARARLDPNTALRLPEADEDSYRWALLLEEARQILPRASIQRHMAALGPAMAEGITGLADRPVEAQGSLESFLDTDEASTGSAAARELRLPEQVSSRYYVLLSKGADKAGDPALALRFMERSHDNLNIDRLSALNRPGYFLHAANVRFRLKRYRDAVSYFLIMAERFPTLWQSAELVKRIDLFDAVGNRAVPIGGN